MKFWNQKPRKAKKFDWKAAMGTLLGNLKRWWRPVLSWLLFLLGPFAALCSVEILNERNPFTNLNLTEWLMNLVLYAVVWAVLWLIFGRRKPTAAVAVIFFTICGVVNHYVLEYMGRILFPNDLAGIQTAANVIGEYSLAPDKYVWTALAVSLGYLALFFLIQPKQKKRTYFHARWANILMGAAAAGYIYAFFFSPWLLVSGIKTQQWNTQSNGFVLNFCIALRYSQVEKPDGYSLEAVSELVDELLEEGEGDSITLWQDPYIDSPYDAATQVVTEMTQSLTVYSESSTVQPVNIICIMDESFADLSIYDAMETSDDTLTFYHSLEENTIKGWMYSPVTGGGTATVEYEFLTGNAVTFLPMGTVAYQLYVQDGMPSLISWANALGFHTTTFHPYAASGWNRTLVYEYFGADEQLYEEDVENPSYVRNYISDACDFDVIKEITSAEEGDKQFIFNVTMQNHGGYAQSWTNLIRSPVLTGDLEGTSTNAEQYLALMRTTDEALEELIEYYSEQSEPTLIVLFGDHQGKLSTEFYERLYGKSLDDLDMEETETQYVVPFLIWANYDIEEASDVMISANYLGTLMAQVSGYPLTGYQQFLSALYEELPVINRTGYINKEGEIVSDSEELTEEQQELLNQYAILSYYNLFERDDAIDQRFFQLAE